MVKIVNAEETHAEDRIVQLNTSAHDDTDTVMLGSLLFQRYVVVEHLRKNAFFSAVRVHDLHTLELQDIELKSIIVVLINSCLQGFFSAGHFARTALTSPHIYSKYCLPIYDAIVADDHEAVVMKWPGGRSLAQWRQRNQHGQSSDYRHQATAIAQHIASALQSLHDHKTIHGCVSPEHIVVTNDYQVYLWGAGLFSSAVRDKRVQNSALMDDCRAYLSPAVFNGDTVSSSDDVFTYGVIVYELFAHHTPYQTHLAHDNKPPKIKRPRLLNLWQWFLLKKLITLNDNKRWSRSLDTWARLFVSARYWTYYLCAAFVIVSAVFAWGKSLTQQHAILVDQAQRYQRSTALEQQVETIKAQDFLSRVSQLQALYDSAHPHYAWIANQLYAGTIPSMLIRVGESLKGTDLPNYQHLDDQLAQLLILYPDDRLLIEAKQQVLDDFQHRSTVLNSQYADQWENVTDFDTSLEPIVALQQTAAELALAFPSQPMTLSLPDNHSVVSRYHLAIASAIEDRDPHVLFQLWQWPQTVNELSFYSVWKDNDWQPWSAAAQAWHTSTEHGLSEEWPPLVLEYFIQPRLDAWRQQLARENKLSELRQLNDEWVSDAALLKLTTASPSYHNFLRDALKTVASRRRYAAKRNLIKTRQTWQSLEQTLQAQLDSADE